MSNNETFDLTKALPQRTSSSHTQRAYYRWVDQFLADLTGMKPTRGDARIDRMRSLPIVKLLPLLQPDTLEEWLDTLVDGGHSRQGLDQARASIVTLAELLSEEGLVGEKLLGRLKYISTPSVERKETKTVLLNRDQLSVLMSAAKDNSTSHNQMLRNSVAMMMLCMMALRREELSAVRWGDLQRQGDRIILTIRNGGGAIQVPAVLIPVLTSWRDAIGNPPNDSPLIRRIWKGGRIAKAGLSPDGIWLIVKESASLAQLGHVSPDDLRRSVAGGLRDTGHSIEQISKLLRHKNTLITERYLRRIPSQSKEIKP